MSYRDRGIHNGLDPGSAKAFGNRGTIWSRLRKTDQALADYTEAIRLDPHLPEIHLVRGGLLAETNQLDKALADFEEAIRLGESGAQAYLYRGTAWADWVLATCPEAAYRDGKKAVDSANRACELSGFQNTDDIDPLAAAYAEAGDYDAAVPWQTRALEQVADRTVRHAHFSARLKLYEAKKPYRDVE